MHVWFFIQEVACQALDPISEAAAEALLSRGAIVSAPAVLNRAAWPDVHAQAHASNQQELMSPMSGAPDTCRVLLADICLAEG